MIGVLVERSARAVAPGLNWSLTLIALAVAVGLTARRRTPAMIGLLAVSVAAAAALTVRGTPWLVTPNLIVALASLILAASFARGGRWNAVTPLGIVVREVEALVDAASAPAWIARGLVRLSPKAPSTEAVDGPDGPTTTGEWASRLLGALVAVPLAGTLIALLASGDERFARLSDPSVWGSPAWSAFLVIVGVWIAGFVLHGAQRSHEPLVGPTSRISAAAGNVVMGSMAAVFAAFAASRLMSLSTLEERVVNTRGVTWSGEARTGFFQLLAVAVITFLVLVGVRVYSPAGPERSRRLARRLTLVNCGLILVVVVTAVQALWAYQARYGWTMLRLATTATAVWFGAVFLIVAAAAVRGPERSRWLTAAVVTSAVVALGLANLANPAGFASASNLERAAPAGAAGLDIDYVVQALGDDGLPALAEAADRLTPEQRARVRAQVCQRPDTGGWWSFQWSRHQADVAAERLCSG